MTKQEKQKIEAIAWNQLKNCKYYKKEKCKTSLKYEIGRLMSTIHIMIEMNIPYKEILEEAQEFNQIQIHEKSKERCYNI